MQESTALTSFHPPAQTLFRQIRRYAIPLLSTGIVLWLILAPLILLFIFSLREGTPWQPGGFTLRHYIDAYSDPQAYAMFVNTVILALASTLLSLSIAVFFAFLTERTDMPLRNVAWGLMLVPMAVPGLLFGVSWTFLLSPKVGLLNVWMRSLLSWFGIEMAEGPLNIYSLWGMIFLEGIRGVTTIFLMIVGAFRAMDPSLEEAAKVSGASNARTFFRVFIPLLTPALLAAGIYSFMSSLESLEIPMIVGFPAGIYVFPTYIFFSVQRFAPPRYGLSAALGVVYLVVSVLLVMGYRRVARESNRFATITGKGYRPRVIRLGKWRYPAFFAFLVYFTFTIALPALILLWRSLIRFYVPPSRAALSQVSLRQYQAVLGEDRVFEALVNTVIAGVATATLTMALSLIVAWVIVRGTIKGRGLLDGLTFLPHSIPGVVIALALIILYLQPPFSYVPIYGTIWLIVIGLTASYIAFGSRTMNGALLQIHRELEEAAQMSGLKWPTILRRIILPLLLPAFVSGWIWVASHSLRSFSIPLMLGTRNNKVLSVVMWDLWEGGSAGPTCALGVMLIAALAIMTVAGRWLVSRMSRQQET
ncbi:MAG TPA: iron ABC transporter permease [Candidatus Acidoferrales bacterium]|nr:iron ABC transporter permease [Candidatus Acidoferrales bacterium]